MSITQTLPLYVQLKEEIINAIAQGVFGAGDQLPSQRSLCGQYGMSHMTVRRAISELINDGVIYAIPGKGIYVAERKQDAEAGPLIGFTEDMARRGMIASSRVLAAEITNASTVLARTLEVDVGEPLVYLRRLRLANDEPMAVQTSYLPHALCPGLLDYDLSSNSLFSLLRDRYQLALADSQVAVESALADEEMENLLGLERPAALLITEQLTYLSSGRVVEFARSMYRADRYRMRLR
jgi:GntR family transcriptional regulator